MSDDKLMTNGMLIVVDGEKYMMPVRFITRFFKAAEENFFTDPNMNAMIKVSEGVYAIVSLSECLGLPYDNGEIYEKTIIVSDSKGRKLCLIADALLGERQFTVEPLPELCDGGKYILGCTTLEDDGLCLVLNAEAFFEGIPVTEEVEVAEEKDKPQGGEEDKAEDEPQNMYLTFEINAETYIISLTDIKEISARIPIVRVPDAPGYMEGVINRRGEIIPVINLRQRFSMPANPPENTAAESIVFINHDGKAVGFVVDNIRDAVRIDDEQIVLPPGLGRGYHNSLVSRIAQIDGRVLFMPDLNKILSVY